MLWGRGRALPIHSLYLSGVNKNAKTGTSLAFPGIERDTNCPIPGWPRIMCRVLFGTEVQSIHHHLEQFRWTMNLQKSFLFSLLPGILVTGPGCQWGQGIYSMKKTTEAQLQIHLLCNCTWSSNCQCMQVFGLIVVSFEAFFFFATSHQEVAAQVPVAVCQCHWRGRSRKIAWQSHPCFCGSTLPYY